MQCGGAKKKNKTNNCWMGSCPNHPSLLTFCSQRLISGSLSGLDALHELSKLPGKVQVKVWDSKVLLAALENHTCLTELIQLCCRFQTWWYLGCLRSMGSSTLGMQQSTALDLVTMCKTFAIPCKLNVQLKIHAGIHSGETRQDGPRAALLPTPHEVSVFRADNVTPSIQTKKNKYSNFMTVMLARASLVAQQ